MKLSQLSPEQKTRLLAELDGIEPYESPDGLWSFVDKTKDLIVCNYHQGLNEEHLWRILNRKYINSYDAIIPLIQKVLNHETPDRITLFQDYLSCLVGIEREDWKMEWNKFNATPSQLCDAVLVATGKAEL